MECSLAGYWLKYIIVSLQTRRTKWVRASCYGNPTKCCTNISCGKENSSSLQSSWNSYSMVVFLFSVSIWREEVFKTAASLAKWPSSQYKVWNMSKRIRELEQDSHRSNSIINKLFARQLIVYDWQSSSIYNELTQDSDASPNKSRPVIQSFQWLETFANNMYQLNQTRRQEVLHKTWWIQFFRK